jgi:hypothetical protein
LSPGNPNDPWPDHLNGSMTGSGFKIMLIMEHGSLIYLILKKNINPS